MKTVITLLLLIGIVPVVVTILIGIDQAIWIKTFEGFIISILLIVHVVYCTVCTLILVGGKK